MNIRSCSYVCWSLDEKRIESMTAVDKKPDNVSNELDEKRIERIGRHRIFSISFSSLSMKRGLKVLQAFKWQVLDFEYLDEKRIERL